MQGSTSLSAGPPAVRTFLERLPPLSPTLTLLLATLSREDASFAKISSLIEKDPVLAGNVLGLVNSSLYGRKGRVNSVRHAVSLLGVTKLRNAALGMSVTRMWNRVSTPTAWSMQKFNRHALAVAMLADLLSQEASLHYPEGAFAAGLLHDLGKLLIAACRGGDYNAIQDIMLETGRAQIECELEILGTSHAELSGDAMRAWSLPPAIESAVRFHHSPERDTTPRGSQRFTLSYAIATADQYVNQQGWTAGDFASPAKPQLVYTIDDLGIGDVQRVLDLFHEEFESLGGIS